MLSCGFFCWRDSKIEVKDVTPSDGCMRFLANYAISLDLMNLCAGYVGTIQLLVFRYVDCEG